MKCPIKFEVITKSKWFYPIKYYTQIVDKETNEILFISKGCTDRKEAYDKIKLIQNNASLANIYFSCDE